MQIVHALNSSDSVVEVVNESRAQDAGRVGRQNDDAVEALERGGQLRLDHVGGEGDGLGEEERLVGDELVGLVVASNGELAVGRGGDEGQQGSGVAAKVERVDAEGSSLRAGVLRRDGGSVLRDSGDSAVDCHVGLGESIDTKQVVCANLGNICKG